MRAKTLKNSKLVVKVISNKETKKFVVESVFDNMTQSYWTDEQISECGIKGFVDNGIAYLYKYNGIEELKETLNWNLNGDSSKFKFGWGQSGKETSDGYAYIFD